MAVRRLNPIRGMSEAGRRAILTGSPATYIFPPDSLSVIVVHGSPTLLDHELVPRN
jgi:hypothetical protein